VSAMEIIDTGFIRRPQLRSGRPFGLGCDRCDLEPEAWATLGRVLDLTEACKVEILKPYSR